MVPSGYHSNVLIIKNYCDGFFADLGQGHSQNIQSFGLGGHLFWECPCPRALPPHIETWQPLPRFPPPQICISMSANVTYPSGFVRSFLDKSV